jgi:hypothetical protein
VAQHPTVLVGEQKRAAAMEQILAAAKVRKEENVRDTVENFFVDSRKNTMAWGLGLVTGRPVCPAWIKGLAKGKRATCQPISILCLRFSLLCTSEQVRSTFKSPLSRQVKR